MGEPEQFLLLYLASSRVNGGKPRATFTRYVYKCTIITVSYISYTEKSPVLFLKEDLVPAVIHVPLHGYNG
jgi:hypothetical protein